MRITFACHSNAGPRSVNEDFLDCWVAATGETIACVADGLGGMGGGNVASKLAVNCFKDYLLNGAITEQYLLDAARLAHEAIRAAQQTGTKSRMATTLTAVALNNDRILGVHCGDSRAAIARGRGIKRLTTDHSEGQRLYEAGKLSKEELAGYPRQHILESALGHSDTPRIDSFNFDLWPGDRVILTTDGVHNLVRLREMQRLAAASSEPIELIDRVVEAIQARNATDNYSIVTLFAE